MALGYGNAGAGVRKVFAEAVDEALAGRMRGNYLTDTSLVFLKKPAGGARPVGMGGLLRRVAGRCAAAALASSCRAGLEANRQYGLSEKGTHRVAATAVRLLDEDHHLMTIDVENAFNSVHRRTVLESIPPGTHATTLATSLYATTTRGRLPDGRWLTVPEGVVQGCPLAPGLFALALDRVRKEMEPRLPSDATDLFYADDTTVATKRLDAFVEYRKVFKEVGARHGLVENAVKSTILVNPSAPPAIVPTSLPCRVLALKVTGTPIAPNEMTHRQALTELWSQRIKSMAAKTAVLAKLEHPQWVLRGLVLASTWSRLKQIVGPAPPDRGPSPSDLAILDDTDRTLLRLALGRYAPQLGMTEWLWASLPRKMGGLGIQTVHKEAAIDSTFSDQYTRALVGGDSDALRETDLSRDQYRENVNRDLRDSLLNVLPKERKVALLDGCTEASRAWMDVDATEADGKGGKYSTLMTEEEASVGIAACLGLHVLPEGYECRDGDAACKTLAGAPITTDVYGHHAANCRRTFHPRHAAMQGEVFRTLDERHCKTLVWEAAMGADGRPRKARPGELRPGDVAVLRPVNEKSIYADVTARGPPAGMPSDLTIADCNFVAKHADAEKAKEEGPKMVVDRRQTMARLSFSHLGTPSKAARTAMRDLAIVCPGKFDPAKSTQNTAAIMGQRLSLAVLTSLAKNVVTIQAGEPGSDSPAARSTEFSQTDEALQADLLGLTNDEADDDSYPRLRRQLVSGLANSTHGYSSGPLTRRRHSTIRPSCRAPSLKQSRRSLLYHAVVWRALAPFLNNAEREAVKRWTSPADEWLLRLAGRVYPQREANEIQSVIDGSVLPSVVRRCLRMLTAINPGKPLSQPVLQENVRRLAGGLVGKVTSLGSLISKVFARPNSDKRDEQLFELLVQGERMLEEDVTWDALRDVAGLDVTADLYQAPTALGWPTRIENPSHYPPASTVNPVGSDRPWDISRCDELVRDCAAARVARPMAGPAMPQGSAAGAAVAAAAAALRAARAPRTAEGTAAGAPIGSATATGESRAAAAGGPGAAAGTVTGTAGGVRTAGAEEALAAAARGTAEGASGSPTAAGASEATAAATRTSGTAVVHVIHDPRPMSRSGQSCTGAHSRPQPHSVVPWHGPRSVRNESGRTSLLTTAVREMAASHAFVPPNCIHSELPRGASDGAHASIQRSGPQPATCSTLTGTQRNAGTIASTEVPKG